jgi:protein-S-isoprenylcysteine O-methyltransferase Ste14
MTPNIVIAWLWGAWLVSWLIAAAWADRSSKNERRRAELGYLIVQVVGVYLLVLSGMRRWGAMDAQLWNAGLGGGWAMAALVLAGLAFTWWARLHLGRLWSGNVARKADHRIVDSGPYALTRHPIYTGILLVMLATALAVGRPFALGGFGLLALGLWMKARMEEKFLRAELGAAAYDAYARRTPMLVPFLR